MQLSLLLLLLAGVAEVTPPTSNERNTCERPLPQSKTRLSTIHLANPSSPSRIGKMAKANLPTQVSGEKRYRSSNSPRRATRIADKPFPGCLRFRPLWSKPKATSSRSRPRKCCRNLSKSKELDTKSSTAWVGDTPINAYLGKAKAELLTVKPIRTAAADASSKS